MKTLLIILAVIIFAAIAVFGILSIVARRFADKITRNNPAGRGYFDIDDSENEFLI